MPTIEEILRAAKEAGATAVGMVQIRTAVPQTAGVPLG